MPRPMNPKPKFDTKRITFHAATDMANVLESESKRTHKNTSQIIRKALDKYFNIEARREDTEFFSGIVQQAVKEEIGKQANRLAAMLFKIGVISAGNYFLAVRILSDS